jgi:DNA polymerase I-like protein with 3'-5' exonuclease and polymerase domains
MGPFSLGQRLGQTTAHAADLLRLHRRLYRRFWEWSDGVVNHAALYGHVYTTFGWRLRTEGGFNERSLRNFPMQANGAEMLRLACCFVTEGGIRLCMPVHDALLVEAPVERIDDVVREAQSAMAQTSRYVLDGFELRTEAKIIRYPDRFMDPRGEEMWIRVWRIVEQIETGKVLPARLCDTTVA